MPRSALKPQYTNIINAQRWHTHTHTRHSDGGRDRHTHTNYDDLMQTTIFHKVFLIMYSAVRRV